MRWTSVIIGAALVAACKAEPETQEVGTSSTVSTERRALTPAEPATAASTPSAAPAVAVGGLGSCQPSEEVSQLASRWIGLADADRDGKISRNEAQAFTNFLLGGFFFRADSDGNGTVTPEEGREARIEFVNQHPGVATLLQQARNATGESPFKSLANILDVEYGKPLSAEDARTASRAALDDLFRVTDANNDDTITLAEARDASWQGARALGQQVFQSVDSNGDGRVAIEEFQAAVSQTAKQAFDAADANDNSELTQEEAAVALGSVVRRLGVPVSTRGTSARR